MKLRDLHSWDLLASSILAIVVISLIILYLDSHNPLAAYIGLVFILFLPGYTISVAIYPRQDDLDSKERIFFILWLSIVSSLFAALVLNLTLGLGPGTLAITLALLSLVMAVIAHLRRTEVPRHNRFTLGRRRSLRPFWHIPFEWRSRNAKMLFILLIMSSLFSAAYIMIHGSEKSLTEFSIIEANGMEGKELEPAVVGENGRQIVRIVNHERGPVNYTLLLVANGLTLWKDNIRLSQGQTWENPVNYFMKKVGNNQKLELELFKGGNFTVPYMVRKLLINVSGNKSNELNETSIENISEDELSDGNASLAGDALKMPIIAQDLGATGSSETSSYQQESASTSTYSDSGSDGISSDGQATETGVNVSNQRAADGLQTGISNSTKFMLTENGFGINNTENKTANYSSKKTILSYIYKDNNRETPSYPNPNSPAVLVDLYPNKPSPQIAGTFVLWTANFTDLNGKQVLYKFFLNNHAITGWSSSKTWNWITYGLAPGEYKIRVWARNGEKAGDRPFDRSENTTFVLLSPNRSPVLTSLNPDVPSPQSSGIIVTWTANVLDPNSEHILYKFFLNDREVQDWSASNSWRWNTSSATPGNYQIDAQARYDDPAGKPSDYSSKEESFVLDEKNRPPELISLIPNKHSPQLPGTIIQWTANGKDNEKDKILYRFLFDGEDATGWSESNIWNWNTHNATLGNHIIGVQVKDGRHAGPDGFDRSIFSTYTLAISNQPPVFRSLIPNKSSPQPQGTTILWKANASDPDGDKIFYKFALDGQAMTGWSESNIWNWSTSEVPLRNYQISVFARDGKHSSEQTFDASLQATFSIISQIEREINQVLNDRSIKVPNDSTNQSAGITLTGENVSNVRAVLGKGRSISQAEEMNLRKLGNMGRS